MNRATLADLFTTPEGGDLIEMLGHIDGVVRDFCRQHPKRLLYEEGQRRRILVGMVSSPKNISESPQLAARDWFLDLEDPGRGVTLRYPGFPWQLKGTPATLRRPAPLLGEHTNEVLGELGLSQDEIGELAAAEVI
jgi:crotonobetainyl-CoA:carnitine CoA-transferase CaiB-like acyl-CoA transferase